MNFPEIFDWPLRVAGAGLIALAVLHVPIARRLRWKEEAAVLSPLNESVFHVHTFFICLVLVLMGLPSLVTPAALYECSMLGKWMSVSWAMFWLLRLYCQWFVYKPALWKGKRLETIMHWWFTLVWIFLTTVYGAVAAWQFGLWR